MRLFVALHLSDRIRGHVSEVQMRLRQVEADVRWVDPPNFHLTVMYLGDLGAQLLPDIEAACETIASETAPFRFRIAGVGSFPKRGPGIKTVLMHVTDGANDWKALAKRAEPWFVPMGAAKEGGLVPHITLGRVKSDRNLEALRHALVQESDADAGVEAADEIALVESTLTPDGALYRDVRRWSLSG